MSRRSLVPIICAIATLAGLAVPTGAAARYGNAADGVEGAQLISADYARLEQGDDTTRFAAISADGDYVAIDTQARNFFADDDPDPPGRFRAGGVFRFDLRTRALEKVADGNLFEESGPEPLLVHRGASNPSISGNGRYVAFATAEPLISADTNDNVDVYVRDMTVPLQPGGVCIPGPVCAYELVSARDGGDVPATYGPPQFPFPGSNPGAEISRGVAISGDGRKVAFKTEAPSDLPASVSNDVAAGQIFVRDLAAKTTTLVTRSDPGGQPAGGAVGAALSADGTTVAWTGANAPAQTRFLEGENTDPGFLYYLWRRVADGPTAPARRITGLADPDDPACLPGTFSIFNQTSTGPCYGPLTDPEAIRTSIASLLPALSGDGMTVAFLTGAGPRPNANTGTGLDLFVAEMAPEVSRKQATVELTRDPANFDPATSSPISSVAMSAGGRFLALTTVRTDFVLPALRLLGGQRPLPNVRELYVVDLQDRSLERVTHSVAGGDIDGEVQNGVTLSADGSRVAFSSFAGNLFFGDANQRADTFVATRLAQAGEGGAAAADGGGSSIQVSRPGPRLIVRAKTKAAGVVVLTISAPAAGSIKAVAIGRTGQPPKKQVIASRRTHVRGKGSFNLVIRAKPRFRAQLQGGRKLHARVKVVFAPGAGGRRLHASTAASFSD